MRRFIASFAAVALLALAGQAFADYQIFVTFTAQKGTKFPGESTAAGHEDAVPVVRFSREVKSPHDAASGMASGKRTHETIQITHLLGAASAALHEAHAAGTVFSEVKIEFVPTSTNHRETPYTIELREASISELKQYTEDKAPNAANVTVLEQITLEARHVEVKTTSRPDAPKSPCGRAPARG